MINALNQLVIIKIARFNQYMISLIFVLAVVKIESLKLDVVYVDLSLCSEKIGIVHLTSIYAFYIFGCFIVRSNDQFHSNYNVCRFLFLNTISLLLIKYA